MYNGRSKYYSDNEEEDFDVPVKSRAEKVMEAKRAFGGAGSSDRMNGYSDNSYRNMHKVNKTYENEQKPPFMLIRFIAAAMLFLILLFAVKNDFSFEGFDKEYIMKCLENNDYWNMLVEKAGDAASEVVAWYRSIK